MRGRTLISPTILFIALAFILPHMGFVDSAVYLAAFALAVCAWVTGRIGYNVGRFFIERNNACAGILPTVLITFGGGFLLPLFAIGFMADGVSGMEAAREFAPWIAAIVCFGGWVLRLIVGALLPAEETSSR